MTYISWNEAQTSFMQDIVWNLNHSLYLYIKLSAFLKHQVWGYESYDLLILVT